MKMFNQKSSNLMLILLIAVAVALAGCGGSNEAAPVTDQAAPLAMEEAALAEKPVAEAVVEAVEETDFDLIAGVDAYMSTIPEGYMVIKLDAFKEIMDSGQAVVIDVREVGEYAEGHIPDAVNIPLRTLAQNLDKIPGDKPVVVYCKSGYRAGVAVSALRMLGYENARAFVASYKGWTGAGEVVATELYWGESYNIPEIEPELLAAVDEFLGNIPEGFLAMGDIEKLNDAIDNGAFLLDVREAREYLEGHIPGAVNIPIRTLAQNLDQIPTDRPVFIYCKSGHRAALSIAALQTLGFSNARTFPPGFAGWLDAGQPIAAMPYWISPSSILATIHSRPI
jgi:rhodanese-related sulfurtransferase